MKIQKKGIFSALKNYPFKRLVMIDVEEDKRNNVKSKHIIAIGNEDEFYKFDIRDDKIEIQYNGSDDVLEKLKEYFGDKNESNV